MSKPSYIFILLFVFLTKSSFAQIQIPFQLTKYNNLVIKAVLNQKDTVNLMFHTAASSLTLTEEATKKISSLVFDRTDSVSSWGGNGNASRFSKSNTLQIGKLQWDNIPIWENTNSGPETDGKFGLELFANKIIEINFDKKKIIIHDKLPTTKGYQQLPLIYKDEMIFVKGDLVLQGDDVSLYQQPFLIHSGYSGAVLVDDVLARKYKLDTKLEIINEKSLKDSFGNILKTKTGILPGFYLGNRYLKQVPLSFFSGALGQQKISIIGGDILKRFHIIIDAKREYIYLKANKLIAQGYWKE
jgi:hypothetical protein